ncbi:MAG: hypothetical protein ACTSRG_19770 [Candidatus Helarchaeota archaeon]
MFCKTGNNVWAKEIVKNPPLAFMNILTLELQRAIKNDDITYIKKL